MSAPKLRFKEFDANWSLSSLGKMTTYFKGYAFKSESYKDSGIRVIRVSDLGRESIKTDNDSIYIEANKASAYENWIIKKDDIIITTVGSKPHLVDSAVGRPIYVKNNNEGLLNQNLLVLRPIDETVNSYFIYAQLLDKKYLTHIELIQRGNANQSNITVKDLQDFETYITSKEEQTKIATFLSAVDEKISQLSQKLHLLGQYKQGMMQKLFSQQIRFKADDGSEFGELKIGKLGDMTSIQGGFAFKSTNFGKGITKVIRIGDIEKNINLNLFSGICSNEIPDTRYLISENAIVMALSGATFGKLGKVKQGSAYINQRVATFHVFEDSLNEFVYQIMLSQEFTTYIQSIPSASAQPNISNQDVINFDMLIPCLEEQTKIANFLSAIDQKMDVVSEQLKQAKIWKKGLLQQMFV